MNKTERFVESVVAELTELPISICHDWTTRTMKAKETQSQGGVYKSRFRNYERSNDEQFDGCSGVGISLRLCRYMDDATDWNALRE